MEKLPDIEFLLKIRALSRKNGVHPTVAGLLMFGKKEDIVTVFPEYALTCFCEQKLEDTAEESGNLFEFYHGMEKRIEGWSEDKEVQTALKEAAVNALIHTDYFGRGGVRIMRKGDSVVIENPGLLRTSREEALHGVSDLRNETLGRMFFLAGLGEGSGGGLYFIHKVWRERGWEKPCLREFFLPERTVLSLKMMPSPFVQKVENDDQVRAVVDYLTEHVEAEFMELERMLGLSSHKTQKLLRDLMDEGIVEKTERSHYRLKT